MSYLDHFNLEDQPFRLTPDPDYLYWSKQHGRNRVQHCNAIISTGEDVLFSA